jgi:MFS transporter, YNFM family, putative membrane transport protein
MNTHASPISAHSATNTAARIACQLEAGTPSYRRASLAMFVGGFASFAMLYGTQPVLPQIAQSFALAPATASLSVAAGTAGLALLLIPASVLADRFGRERIMKLSLLLSALLALAASFAGTFEQLLALRALQGAAIAGLPAAAMAYLGEEVGPASHGRAMGLYIAGNAFGGMCGRFLTALLTEWLSWRWGLAALGVLGIVAALVFWRTLPAARHYTVRSAQLGPLLADARSILGDRGLRALFLTAFLLMGAFVGLYNYLGFRLVAPPYGLGPSAIGAIFLLYVVGSASSAWTGQLTDRLGRRNVLWIMIACMAAGLALTLASALAVVIGGVAFFTFGFFGAHTAASGWVSRRATERRALAAALYLCSYYLGGSLLGSVVGLAWDRFGWSGVAIAIALCIAAVLGVALRLRQLPPRTQPASLQTLQAAASRRS